MIKRARYLRSSGAAASAALVALLSASAVAQQATGTDGEAGPASTTQNAPLPEYEQFISEILELDFLNVPAWRITLAGIVLLLGIFLRTGLLTRLLAPFRHLASKTETDLDDRLLEATRRPLGWVVNVVAMYVAVIILRLPEGLHSSATLMLKTLATVFAAWLLFNVVDVVSHTLERLAKRTESEIDDQLVPLLKRVLRVILVTITIIMIIQQWGYDVTSLVAGLGLGGLAFALAAQSTLSNWFGSLMIFTDRPFTIGDWIRSEHGEGVVEEIGLRSTKIRTLSKTQITVPNSDIATTAVENMSRMPARRIHTTIGVVYSTTAEQLEEIVENIRELMRTHELIDQSFWYVHFTGFGASSLDIEINAFTSPTDWHGWLDARQDIFFQIMRIVEQAGSSFAFPSRSIYFENPLPPSGGGMMSHEGAPASAPASATAAAASVEGR